MYICIYEYMYICIYVCMYICIHVYMYMYIYIYTYTYIYILVCSCAYTCTEHVELFRKWIIARLLSWCKACITKNIHKFYHKFYLKAIANANDTIPFAV